MQLNGIESGGKLGDLSIALLALMLAFSPTVIAQSSNTFPTSGNAGVGTTSPEKPLDVYAEGSDPTALIQIRANRTGYGNVRGIFEVYAGGSTSSDRLFFGTDSSSASSRMLTLLGNGNVGIGTTTPGFRFTVQQDSATAQQFAIQNDNTAAGRYSELLFRHSNGVKTEQTGVRPAICDSNLNRIADVLNRVTSRSYSDSTPDVTYAYDTVSTYGKGRLTSVSSDVSGYSYSGYDALGRALGATQTIGNQTYSISNIAYDRAGHVTSMTYPSGHTVTNTFDNGGRLYTFAGRLGDNTLRTR